MPPDVGQMPYMKTKTLYVRIPDELYQRIEAEAQHRGENISVIIRECARKHLDTLEPSAIKDATNSAPPLNVSPSPTAPEGKAVSYWRGKRPAKKH
jgi:negative regulator of replication initiation